MPKLGLVIEVSGEVDFESRSPILIEETGRRWRLENASGLLVGDRVKVAATKQDFTTLLVRAMVPAQPAPAPAAYHRHH